MSEEMGIGPTLLFRRANESQDTDSVGLYHKFEELNSESVYGRSGPHE